MGLLDKAQSELSDKGLRSTAQGVREEHSLLAKANSLIQGVPPETPTPAPEPPAPEEPEAYPDDELEEPFTWPQPGELIQSSTSLPSNLEKPSRLLGLLHQALPSEKTALLLRDFENNEYKLWAAFGLDQTTRHRLRLPDSLLKDIGCPSIPQGGLDNQILQLSETELDPLEPFFSLREYSSLEEVFLLSLNTDDEPPIISGFILLIPDPFDFSANSDRARLQKLWQDVNPALCQALADFQGFSAPPAQAGIDEIADRIGIFTQECKRTSQPALILSIDYEPFLANQEENNEAVEPYRLQELLHRAVSALFGQNTEMFRTAPTRAVILLSGQGVRDPQLVTHQIALSLQAKLSLPEPNKNFLFQSIRFPDDETDPETIAQEISGQSCA